MALNAAFYSRGPLYLIGVSAVNCPVTDGSSTPASYRVKCIHAARQYITWGTASTVSSVGAPTAGVPSAMTYGMEPNQTEVFNGIGPWFIATAAASFEVMPGEGE